jgi:hypothetical protein
MPITSSLALQVMVLLLEAGMDLLLATLAATVMPMETAMLATIASRALLATPEPLVQLVQMALPQMDDLVLSITLVPLAVSRLAAILDLALALVSHLLTMQQALAQLVLAQQALAPAHQALQVAQETLVSLPAVVPLNLARVQALLLTLTLMAAQTQALEPLLAMLLVPVLSSEMETVLLLVLLALEHLLALVQVLVRVATTTLAWLQPSTTIQARMVPLSATVAHHLKPQAW